MRRFMGRSPRTTNGHNHHGNQLKRLAKACGRGLAGLGVVLATLTVSNGIAQAVDVQPREYGFSTDDVHQVGTISGPLSKLCRLGQFNQRRIGEYYLVFGGEGKTRNYIGIAKQNYNLYDPTGQATPDKTYHFLNDGTSQCRVFVAP